MKKHIPVIDPSLCTRCGQCVAACKKNVIQPSNGSACAKCIGYCITMQVPCSPQNYVFSYRDCDGCGICISTCPNNAIYWFMNETTDIKL